jgi:hypothetical protein
MQRARVLPTRHAPRRIGIVDVLVDDVYVDPPLADAQRGLERLEHPAALGAAGAKAVLHHFEHDELGGRSAFVFLAAPLFLRASGGIGDDLASLYGGGALQKARVSLLLQQLTDLGFLEVLRHRYGKAQQ